MAFNTAYTEVSSTKSLITQGTYAPVIQGETTNPSGTYLRQEGKWTKVGNRVIVDIDVSLDCNLGTLGSGYMRCSLPFVASQNIVTVGNFINLSQSYTIGNITPFIDVVNYGSYLLHFMFADGENKIVQLGDDIYLPFYSTINIQSHIEYFV